jgi:phosphohistidine phosphatase SixA
MTLSKMPLSKMTIYLLRHASAGVALADRASDRDRPLDSKGIKQAQAIAERLGALEVSGLYSSPYLRCVQTLDPLAQSSGLAICHREELAEGHDFAPALELCESLADGAVICSHGDVIPALIEAMIRRGLEISGPTGFRKASIWVIERSAKGEWASATWWDRPL